MQSGLRNAFMILFLSLLAVSQGEVFYKTGFEATNEPFGNYTRDASNGMSFSSPKGGVTAKSAHWGTQAITLGGGDGSYGKIASKIFAPPIESDSLWLEYRFRSDDEQPAGYKAFLYLNGSAAGKSFSLVRLLFYANRITAAKAGFPFKLGTNWHHVKIHLKYATQNYDLNVDDRIFPDIPFTAGKLENVAIRGLDNLLLGGGASMDKLTFYDDLSIGSEEPVSGPADAPPAVMDFPDQNNVPYVAMNPASAPPVIDGKLEDACWLNASCLTPFVSTSGDFGKQQQTQVFVTYDRDNVYIGFKCFDIYLNPVLNQLHMVSAKATDRDAAVFKDDSVEIFLATFPDRPDRFYQIAVNCAGTIYDAALPDPGVSWNGALEVGTYRNEKHWNLEIKIPLKDIGVTNLNVGNTWRVNFCRNKPSLAETTTWSPTFGSFHNFNKFGILKFAENAPVVRSVALPAVLAERTNALEFQLASDRNVKLLLQTKVAYANADKVVDAVAAAVQTGKTTKAEARLIIDSTTAARINSQYASISYRVMDAASGEPYYTSTELKFPLLKYTPFRTRFLTHASGVYFHYFTDMYIANNSSLLRHLLIQYADDVGAFTNCEFVIDMPECLTLMTPSFSTNRWSSLSGDMAVTQEIVSTNGINRHRYTVTVPRIFAYPTKQMGLKNRYTNSIDLIFLCASDKSLPLDETVVYNTSAQVDGKTVAEPPVTLPLHILPTIKGVQPQKYPIVSSFDGYNAALSKLSPDKREACLGNMIQAGFNVFSALDNAAYPQAFLDEVRAKGLKIERGYFPTQANYFNALYPDPREFLEKHPQYRAVHGNGAILTNEVSLSHLLNDTDDGEYRLLLKKRIAEVAQRCDMILWDHEVTTTGRRAVSFSAADLDDFRRYADIKDDVSIDDVQVRYKNQWDDFQLRRFAQRALLIRRLIKQANPDCLFGVYSGYQHTPPIYGTDWKLMAEAIDYAQCGYGRPLGALEATIKAIAPKKLTAGEGIYVSAGDVGYNFDNMRLNLFRRITDSNGGLMVFYGTIVDGRFWTAVGDISRLVSEFEPFFLNHVRDDALIEIKSGFSKDDVAVLRNADGARLIFLFNNSAEQKVFEFRNLSPLPNARLRDYYENKDLSNSVNVSVEVKSLDVKVLVYGP
ncbi:MAG: hypothetical protein KJ692_02750 [Verrucomicrobia bacterium]|nr:hypothetical protein [Verrucomicrobiota bacterium]